MLKKRKQERARIRLEAFNHVSGSAATTPWLRSKLMVVGRGAAGKTNTVRSLIGRPLNPEWDSTVGVELTEISTLPNSLPKSNWKKAENKDFAITFLHRLAVESLQAMKKGPDEAKDNDQRVKATLEKTKSVEMKTVVASVDPNAAKVQLPEEDEAVYKFEEELFLAQEDSKDAIRMSIWD